MSRAAIAFRCRPVLVGDGQEARTRTWNCRATAGRFTVNLLPVVLAWLVLVLPGKDRRVRAAVLWLTFRPVPGPSVRFWFIWVLLLFFRARPTLLPVACNVGMMPGLCCALGGAGGHGVFASWVSFCPLTSNVSRELGNPQPGRGFGAVQRRPVARLGARFPAL